MSKYYLRDALTKYIASFLSDLDGPFEYYYLNTSYPECTLDNMSDKEISYKYPKSGERLMLDCWGIGEEFGDITHKDWESFLKVIHLLVTEVEKENES